MAPLESWNLELPCSDFTVQSRCHISKVRISRLNSIQSHHLPIEQVSILCLHLHINILSQYRHRFGQCIKVDFPLQEHVSAIDDPLIQIFDSQLIVTLIPRPELMQILEPLLDIIVQSFILAVHNFSCFKKLVFKVYLELFNLLIIPVLVVLCILSELRHSVVGDVLCYFDDHRSYISSYLTEELEFLEVSHFSRAASWRL